MNGITPQPVDALIPYAFNNRTHPEAQVDLIANSIKEFGFNQPIVIDEDNVILVGHGRLLAAKKLGLETVPTFQVTGLTEAKKKAYRILDNKLQNDSEWDFANLELELGQLEELGFELAPWGLDTLIPTNEEEPETYEDDGGGALPDEPYIKQGDVIELGPHRVMCGDSTSVENVNQLLNGALIEMMFTDPPYGVNYEGGHFHSGDVQVKRKRESLQGDESDQVYSAFLDIWIHVVDGPCYVFHAGSCPHELYKAIERHQAEIHALIIWHKVNATYAAMNAQYKQRHEPCLYFKPKGKVTRWKGPSDECTIWEEKRDSINNFHPTQKPVCLAARAIKNHDIKIIADPFLGSGSTLIAADQLGRVCYGMEISPAYCQVILERYEKHCATVGKPFVCKINGEPFIKPEL